MSKSRSDKTVPSRSRQGRPSGWKTQLRRRLARAGSYCFSLVWHAAAATWYMLTWPLRATWFWFAVNWERRHTRDLVRGLPAVFALLGIAVLSAAVRVDAKALAFNYWMSAQQAIGREDYVSAEILLQRILDESANDNLQAQFALGEVFEETERQQRAQWLFRKLAPDDRKGYSAAHRKRAVALAEAITSTSTSEEIRRLRWHLSLADQQETPTMARAWAAYYLALNQALPAIERLERAVDEYPELSLLLGSLYLSRQDTERARASYTAASVFLRDRLDRDPENAAIRVTFANTLLKLGELNECEAVLELGLKLDPEGPYKQLLASLYTNRHDVMARQEGAEISELLRYLHAALNYDPNFVPAYERLVAYGEANVEGGANLGEILSEVIARGQEPGLAHFAMSIMNWKDKDFAASKWHLERAHSLLPEMPFVANNLAWLLATEEPLDLQRALAIMQPIVEQYPEEPRLLDTHATILMKLEQWDAAFDDLERALRNQTVVAAQAELHEKLAVVCDKLKQPTLADKHRKLAKNPTAKAGLLPPTTPQPVLPQEP